MAGVGKRTFLREINPYLMCPLCRGYLIDATTVVECLHSFCRSCILKHLGKAAHCPSCKHALNKAKPNIKADKALQDIVYKLVPGLYHKEMRKRREFYKKHPEHADSATAEQRGEDVSGRLIFAPEDAVSLSLEYLPPGVDPLSILSITDADTNHSHGVNNSNNNNHNNGSSAVNTRRYLQCPALVTIAHLKKFLALKYSVDMTRYSIEICHRRAPLPEHWTLMDVAYIYAWKRIAPMRFFYRVAQEEQRLEAPLHQRPSTPGLGACLPPNDVAVSIRDDDANSDGVIEHSITSRSEINHGSDEPSAVEEDSDKISNDNVSSSADNEQKTTIATEVETTNKLSTMGTSSTLTITNTSTMSTSITTVMSGATMCNNDPNNKQMKTPIKIMKNPDGRYEVLRSPPANWSEKEQTVASAATLMDTKDSPSPAEFSVVSIGNGQNSNGVKITLKQRSPTNSTSGKKPKVISNVLLRCSQLEKDSSNALIVQQLHKDKELSFSPVQEKQQEKQRRKVTFVDRPMSEKTSPSGGNIIPKTALKKTAEQQDKRQFLQGFQLTARESVEDKVLKSPVRDIGVINEINSPHKRDSPMPKLEGLLKKDATIDRVIEEEKSNSENIAASNNNTVTNKKRVAGTPASNARSYASKGLDDAGARMSFGSMASPGSVNTNANGSHSTAKMDVYTFHSTEPSIVPAGAVKRKCPPGVPIGDLKRRRQNAQAQGSKKQQTTVSPPNPSLVKLPRISSPEQMVPTSRSTTNASLRADHYHSGLSRASNIGTKVATNPLPLSSDTKNLLDGCGLNIPPSLSITLTAPKSPANTGQFVEPNNDNRKVAALGKVNPSITLNDRSVDPRVLKALKTGQIRMPATPSKGKSSAAKQIEQSEMHQQLRITPSTKRKKEQESILDLSGSGNGKKVDMHPLRIPQPVTKLKTNSKTSGRDNMPGGISDQGQVVTLMGGHRYFRVAPGSLTPAAQRVNDCPPLPPRTPVYAPTLTDVNRTSSNLSTAFPSLQSLYALSQAPNLQQFQMDARLRMSTVSPRTSESGGILSAVAGSSDGTLNSSGLSGMPSKTHISAQCAPIKPARSSVAPLAVPINKQQQSAIDKSTTIVNKSISSDTNKPLTSFRNNDGLTSTDESGSGGSSNNQRLTVQTRYPLGAENANRFLPRNNTDGTKNNDQTFSTSGGNSNAGVRNESTNAVGGSSIQQQQQEPQQEPQPQPQPQDTASPRVSSTASPSPPPGNNNGTTVSSKNDVNASHDNNVNNATKAATSDTNATSSSPMKNKVDTSCKSPASPDSSSVTLESPTSKRCVATTDREIAAEVGQVSDTIKSSSTDSAANLDDSSSSTTTTTTTIDGSAVSADDKSKFANQSPVDATQKLTSEMVQKRLLAVFPSNEWANNPVAAEHLGNFLKSLNATIKNEERHTEESKTEKVDRTLPADNDAGAKKDVIERS